MGFKYCSRVKKFIARIIAYYKACKTAFMQIVQKLKPKNFGFTLRALILVRLKGQAAIMTCISNPCNKN